jgi:hypothetical protein
MAARLVERGLVGAAVFVWLPAMRQKSFFAWKSLRRVERRDRCAGRETSSYRAHASATRDPKRSSPASWDGCLTTGTSPREINLPFATWWSGLFGTLVPSTLCCAKNVHFFTANRGAIDRGSSAPPERCSAVRTNR